MARAASSTRPVEVLGEAIRSLEAAALVCLASQKKRPVHQLRTWTRRIEAQLELIALLPGAPRATKQRDKALRILKKLRRAAGTVRDLDVEGALLAEELRRIRSFQGSPHDARAMRKEVELLLYRFEHQRESRADALASLLKKERKELPRALQRLSAALEPAQEMAITEKKLISLIESWYARCGSVKNLQSAPDIDALHTARKRAKLARYMAEGAIPSGSPSAKRVVRLADRFGALQHVGGTWHDLFQLRDAAAKEFGDSSLLVRRLSARTDRALRTFKQQLAQTH